VYILIALYLSEKIWGAENAIVKHRKLIILSFISALTTIYLSHIAFGYPSPWVALQWWDIIVAAVTIGLINLIYYKIIIRNKENFL
jgi:hypothetical protein